MGLGSSAFGPVASYPLGDRLACRHRHAARAVCSLLHGPAHDGAPTPRKSQFRKGALNGDDLSAEALQRTITTKAET